MIDKKQRNEVPHSKAASFGAAVPLKHRFIEHYFWDIQAYKDNPTEEELQKLIYLMYLEGVHDGSVGEDY